MSSKRTAAAKCYCTLRHLTSFVNIMSTSLPLFFPFFFLPHPSPPLFSSPPASLSSIMLKWDLILFRSCRIWWFCCLFIAWLIRIWVVVFRFLSSPIFPSLAYLVGCTTNGRCSCEHRRNNLWMTMTFTNAHLASFYLPSFFFQLFHDCSSVSTCAVQVIQFSLNRCCAGSREAQLHHRRCRREPANGMH